MTSLASLALAVLLAVQPAPAPEDEYRLTEVATGLSSPLFVTAPTNDARLFVVEQTGTIRIVEGGAVLGTPFLDVSSLLVEPRFGEQGLLGLAFHPAYASNGRFFVSYTGTGGAITVAEFHSTPAADQADPQMVRQLLTIPHPGRSNHNGGMVQFGADGLLYISTGDGGGRGDPDNNAQDTGSLLGKVLRIDVNGDGFPSDSSRNYVIPPNNPFLGGHAGRDEILFYGLRNPWRFWIDAATGRYYIADVGQNTREEVTILPSSARGSNLGWNRLEGSLCYPPGASCSAAGTVLPQVQYETPGGQSITGGIVYRGSLMPKLVGTYFYADFIEGWVRSFKYTGSVTNHLDWSGVLPTSLVSSFGVDGFGEMYIVSLSGTVWRLEPIKAPHVFAGDFSGGGGDDVARFGFDGVWRVGASTGSSFNFGSWASYVPPAGWQFVPGNFTGAGPADMAAYYSGNGTWWVSESDGNSFDTNLWSSNFSPRTGWTFIPGDFNNDGNSDIANYYSGNGTWWVSESDGNSFDTNLWSSNFSPSTGWTFIPGDFNGDGTTDIANYYSGNGTWWVSESDGNSFDTNLWSSNFSPNTGWTFIPGDFNGDGTTDIANYYSGNGTWWISLSTGNGFTTTKWTSNFSPRTGWTFIPGDFNGDGTTDIANYYSGNGTWWISESDGNSFTTSLWSSNFSPRTGWTFTPGDFNNDGTTDIANYYTGNNTWWVSESNGNNFTTTLWSN